MKILSARIVVVTMVIVGIPAMILGFLFETGIKFFHQGRELTYTAVKESELPK